MPYVLAVDAGNSKTIALVASLDGTIVGAGRGGCGDIYDTSRTAPPGMDGVTQALANLDYAITSACAMARIEPDALITGAFNMAGADWPEDYALLQAEIKARGWGQRIHVQNDALGVLHAGTATNIGVSVVCGTWTAIGSRGPDGRSWHASFWLGVGGSVELSHKALAAVVRSELGLEVPTRLRERVLTFFGLETVEDVLHQMTSRNPPNHRPAIDGLTPLLLDEAAAGDQLAFSIVQQHGHAMGEYAHVAAQRAGIAGTTFALVLAGGVFRHPSSLLSDAVIARVRQDSPQVQVTRPRFEPVIGTLFTALEMAGVGIDDDLIERLLPTLPSQTLFETLPGS